MICQCQGRTQWNKNDGYCGELSIQRVGLYNGIWISQNQARLLGGKSPGRELQFDGTLENVLSKLQFTYYNWISYKKLQKIFFLKDYISWVTENVLNGRVTLIAVKIKNGNPKWTYDHIVTVIGINENPSQFIISNQYNEIIYQDLNDTGFYCTGNNCERRYDTTAGCLLVNPPYNYGIAVGNLKFPNSSFHKVEVVLTSWDDGSDIQREPLKNVQGSYRLEFPDYKIGQSFTIYRCDFIGAIDFNDLSKCMKKSFIKHQLLEIDQNDFGKINSNSIVYFITTS